MDGTPPPDTSEAANALRDSIAVIQNIDEEYANKFKLSHVLEGTERLWARTDESVLNTFIICSNPDKSTFLQ